MISSKLLQDMQENLASGIGPLWLATSYLEKTIFHLSWILILHVACSSVDTGAMDISPSCPHEVPVLASEK